MESLEELGGTKHSPSLAWKPFGLWSNSEANREISTHGTAVVGGAAGSQGFISSEVARDWLVGWRRRWRGRNGWGGWSTTPLIRRYWSLATGTSHSRWRWQWRSAPAPTSSPHLSIPMVCSSNASAFTSCGQPSCLPIRMVPFLFFFFVFCGLY